MRARYFSGFEFRQHAVTALDGPYLMRWGAYPHCCGQPRDKVVEAHCARMATPEAKSTCKLRKQTVELAFAELKQHRSLQQFSGRGPRRAQREAGLAVLVHNLLVVHRAIRPPKTDTASVDPPRKSGHKSGTVSKARSVAALGRVSSPVCGSRRWPTSASCRQPEIPRYNYSRINRDCRLPLVIRGPCRVACGGGGSRRRIRSSPVPAKPAQSRRADWQASAYLTRSRRTTHSRPMQPSHSWLALFVRLGRLIHVPSS